MVLPLFFLVPISILPIPIYGVYAMLLNDDENVQNVRRKVLEAAAKEED